METIDAIILAGGLGTRLRSVVSDLPKVLAPVNDRPFIHILLDALDASAKIRRVVIAVGYMADKVMAACSHGGTYGFEIAFSIEEQLLGTGGGIRQALDRTETDDVLALNGDSYVGFDVDALLRQHHLRNTSLSVVLCHVDNASRYGRVMVDAQQRILCFEEKKEDEAPGLINAGVYRPADILRSRKRPQNFP